MSDDAQTVVVLLTLVALLCLLLTPFLLFFVYVFFQNSKRKRIRERMLAAHQELIRDHKPIPVRYCSEARFKAWLKIFPWEGAGVLLPSLGNIVFLGEKLSGAPVTLQFAPTNSEIKWLGKCPWPNGAVSWFEVDRPGERHYFTSETGAFVFGSHKSTRAAYDQAQNSFTSLA